MFDDVRSVDSYYVYSYEHIDDLSFLRDPRDVYGEHQFFGDPRQPLEEWLAKIDDLLRRHGWEGDGKLQIMWFPPFVPVGTETTSGTWVWVVKQDNNGTAFIASPYELPFNRLLAQNRDRPVWEGHVAVGLGRDARDTLVKALIRLTTDLDADLVALTDSLPRAAQIRESLLERVHGQMVQVLQVFLDDCYLRILVDVIIDGNRSGLKLRRAKVPLDPSIYIPEDSDSDTGGFFTLHGLVSDMWRAYKFEPFKEKLEMLLAPVEFKIQPEIDHLLRKHIALRNSIQHHEGQLDPNELKRLGRHSLELAGPDLEVTLLKPWQRIVVPVEELRRLDRDLREFARELDEHLESRLVARFYAKPEDGRPLQESD